MALFFGLRSVERIVCDFARHSMPVFGMVSDVIGAYRAKTGISDAPEITSVPHRPVGDRQGCFHAVELGLISPSLRRGASDRPPPPPREARGFGRAMRCPGAPVFRFQIEIVFHSFQYTRTARKSQSLCTPAFIVYCFLSILTADHSFRPEGLFRPSGGSLSVRPGSFYSSA